MNKSLKLVCLALLVVAVVGEGFGRSLKVENEKGNQASGCCKCGTRLECHAFPMIKLVLTRGSCEGEAVADYKALATSKYTIRKAYDSWWKKDGSGECQVVRLQRAAKAVAEATAAAFAASLVKVKCEGKGFACGASYIDTKAFAVSFARAIAQAAVDSEGSASDAFCMADVEATSEAIAEAAAAAHSQACVKDTGVQQYFQYAMVNKVTKAIATAFIEAMASTCSDKWGFAGAASKCPFWDPHKTNDECRERTYEKRRTPRERDYEKPWTSRETAQQDACKNSGECCEPEYTARFCKPDPYADDMWTRVSEPGETAEFRSWMDGVGVICFCYKLTPPLPALPPLLQFKA